MERRDPFREIDGRKLATEVVAPQDSIATVALDVAVKIPEQKVSLGLRRAALLELCREY